MQLKRLLFSSFAKVRILLISLSLLGISARLIKQVLTPKDSRASKKGIT